MASPNSTFILSTERKTSPMNNVITLRGVGSEEVELQEAVQNSQSVMDQERCE
jgi:hypothetical protein